MLYEEAKKRYLHELEDRGIDSLHDAINKHQVPENIVKQLMVGYRYLWEDNYIFNIEKSLEKYINKIESEINNLTGELTNLSIRSSRFLILSQRQTDLKEVADDLDAILNGSIEQ